MDDEIVDATATQSEIELATAVSGLAVEAAIASADDAQQRNEDLQVWLDERYSIQLQLLTELQNSQLATRETLTTILERIAQTTINQQTQSETLTMLGSSTLAAVQQLQLSLSEETEEVLSETEPEETEQHPSENVEEDSPELPIDQKTRRNTIRKV